MKKLILSTFVAASLSAAEVITVGASVVPHSDILRAAEPILKKEGYDLKIVEYTDYVIPNLALDSGELDANYFQTIPYMQDFNKNKGTKLVSVLGVHVEPMGAYSSKVKKLDELKDSAQVCIPNDPVNEDRALKLIASSKLISFKADNEQKTPLDIEQNPKHLQFKELEAAQLPRAYPECDLTVINANYALEINLNPKRDSLIVEGDNVRYANIIAVKAGNENSPKIQALIKALKSPAITEYIEKTYDGKIQAVNNE